MSDIYGQLGIDPSIAPQPTPALLTYLRGLSLDMAKVTERKQQRLAAVAANKIRTDAQIAEAKTKADTSQVTKASAAGVSRSGEQDKKLAEITANTVKAYGESALQTANETAGAEQEAADRSSDITRSATETLLGMSERQQRDAAQLAAQQEMERARLAAEKEQSDAMLALMREQGMAAAQPYVNPYEVAQTAINREDYASLGMAPPEGNLNLGVYGSTTATPGLSRPIAPGYTGPMLRRPAAPTGSRTTTQRAV